MQNRKQRYNTDLKRMHQHCEASYLYLRQLIADWDHFEHLEFAIDSANAPVLRITLDLQERNPYTSTIMLHQQDVLLPWAEGPKIGVRVYHDARMAEVISWNGHRLLQARYQYPNEKMYLPDEKAQLNQFLGECLRQCLEFGRTLEPVTLR